MEITNVKYHSVDGENNTSIRAIINGQHYSVPLDPANSDYVEIMRQVKAGDLTIEAAD